MISIFIHNFKYALKTLFKNKMLIFWTFAFPIILGTFFNMAFANIEKSEKLKMIDIAIVENENFKNSTVWKQTFKVLSDEENVNRLFNTKYVSKEEAEKLLKNDEITGYVELQKEPIVTVTNSGINETVLKYVIEEIIQSEEIISNIIQIQINEKLQEDPTQIVNIEQIGMQIYENTIEKLQKQEANIQDISSNKLSYTMIEFYTLIAMTCLYGGILGMVAVNQNLANMSHTGKRIGVSPISKGKLILGSSIASYLTQLIGVLLLFIYTIFVLKVDYGNNLMLIILLTLAGCLAGLTMGVSIAACIKANDNLKTGIVISVTMIGCFLSGMMGITMKYMVDKNVPIINKLNPASMITDGFYSLYYYDTLDRFYFNVASLAIFAIIMLGISIISLRRQKYDSI
ncbi:MAG: ABC transporter permease [Clostridia bacterium]|nr:ABC transporter permease [Clostridia bacterium]